MSYEAFAGAAGTLDSRAAVRKVGMPYQNVPLARQERSLYMAEFRCVFVEAVKESPMFLCMVLPVVSDSFQNKFNWLRARAFSSSDSVSVSI